MSNPFDYITAISYTKEDIVSENESKYPAFLVNRGLSYFPDTIEYANEMNMRPHLDKKLQFDYLINIIRKKRRFAKWHKAVEDDSIDAVKQYFNFSTKKAIEAIGVLTENELHLIKEKLKTGG